MKWKPLHVEIVSRTYVATVYLRGHGKWRWRVCRRYSPGWIGKDGRPICERRGVFGAGMTKSFGAAIKAAEAAIKELRKR